MIRIEVSLSVLASCDLKKKTQTFLLMCTSVLPACISAPCVCSIYGAQKRGSEALKLELHMVMGAERIEPRIFGKAASTLNQ